MNNWQVKGVIRPTDDFKFGVVNDIMDHIPTDRDFIAKFKTKADAQAFADLLARLKP